MRRSENSKRVAVRAAATVAFALWAVVPFAALAQEIPADVTWDDPYWQISGAAEAAAIVANTQAVAGADAVVDQSLVNNSVIEQNVTHTALITDSFNGSSGIIDVNQSAGNNNIQGNVRAIALTPGLGAIQGASATVVMEMHGNSITTSGGALNASIANSFNNTSGIVGVNQAAGSLNEETNVLALSLGAGAGQDSIVLDDASLSTIGQAQDNTANEDPNRPKSTGMTNSFNNFTGIAQVNQVAGDLNRVSNALAVSVMMMQ